MRWRFRALGALALAAGLAVFVAPGAASAAPKAKPKSAAQSKTPKKNPKKAEPAVDAASADAKAGAADDKADKGEPSAPKGEPSAPKAAGTNAAKGPAPASATTATVQENKEGVKTYKFGTVEVEGRLKSPQIIYFLRRVRAEFDAGALGHRSFMRELSDTRNNPSLR